MYDKHSKPRFLPDQEFEMEGWVMPGYVIPSPIILLITYKKFLTSTHSWDIELSGKKLT